MPNHSKSRPNISHEYQDKESQKVHVNVLIFGTPAIFLKEYKRRGLALSNRDAIIQGLAALEERMVNLDLKKSELKNLGGTE
jgi:hypothetical protein